LFLGSCFSHDYLSSSEKPGVNGIGTWTQHQDSGSKEDTEGAVRESRRSGLINDDALQGE
jgi:hypothetical protein